MSAKFRVSSCASCNHTYLPQQQDGSSYAHACPPLPPDKNGLQFERPDKRDENFVVNRAGVVTGMKSEGQGAVPFSDAAAAAFVASMQAPVQAPIVAIPDAAPAAAPAPVTGAATVETPA